MSQGDFPVECTVVIPVLNRERVIRDAIASVLAQQAPFRFNLIVVDNHSTDGTSQAIDEFSSDPRLVHLIPSRYDLGIGGCWNLAAYDARCGRFVIGLDSDDVYATPHVLATMVAKFYDEGAAMVVGSSLMPAPRSTMTSLAPCSSIAPTTATSSLANTATARRANSRASLPTLFPPRW